MHNALDMNFNNTFGIATAVLTLAPLAVAQSTLVVPAQRATTDGTSVRRVGGFDDAVRQQLLIAPSHLTAASGQILESISLRRDVDSDGDALVGGDIELQVWLSTASTTVDNPSPTFSANRGSDHTLVFDGIVTLPSLGAVNGIPGGSSAAEPFSVQVDFDPGVQFLYLPGTTLLVEFVGRPVASQGPDWWPVDAEASSVEGSVTEVGVACGMTQRTPHTAFATPRELVPGRVARLGFRGEPSTTAIMIVTLASQPYVLDLPVFGAGCGLHVVPPFVAELAATTGAQEIWPGLGAQATFDLYLPGDPLLLGFGFSLQWVQFGPTMVHLSNALDVQVAGAMPGLGMSLVEAHATDAAGTVFPSEGTVDTTTGLVLRIGFGSGS